MRQLLCLGFGLKEVVELSGGKVRPNTETRKDCVIKNSDDEFTIYTQFIKDPATGKSVPKSYFDVLHEYARACLEEGNGTYSCNGFSENDAAAWYFARIFAMPRESFEEAIFLYGFNAIAVAKAYKLDYIPVMTRGKELNIWK